MDFGSVPPRAGIDFSLGPHRDFRTSGSEPRETRIYVGCSVWSRPTWVGGVYPPGTAERDRLFHYARMFNSVELNATFYKVPSAETVERWCSQVPDDFRFFAKIPKAVSQNLGGPIRQDWAEFLAVSEHFGDRLGGMFLQLPPDFSYADRQALVAFVRRFPPSPHLAVEFRHSSWFENRAPLERMCRWFAENGISIVITDAGGRRDVSHGAVTASKMMVRYLGNGLHPSDEERLDLWAERIRRWVDVGVEEIYFFMHEEEERFCPEMVAGLAKRLGGAALRFEPLRGRGLF